MNLVISRGLEVPLDFFLQIGCPLAEREGDFGLTQSLTEVFEMVKQNAQLRIGSHGLVEDSKTVAPARIQIHFEC